MKKLFSILALIAAVLASSNCFANVGIRLNGVPVGAATDINLVCGSGTNSSLTVDGSIYNINCSTTLQTTGIANGGATSLATIDTGIPLTFAYVRKSINTTGAGTATDTLANGTPGQVLTIFISQVNSTNTWTVGATTATGFKTVAFNAVGQSAMFTYVNDTVGWIVSATGSTGSTSDPVITLSTT